MDEIRKLIGRNRIEEAFDQLDELIQDDVKLYQSLLTIKARYEENETQRAIGTISYNKYGLVRQNVINGILTLISEWDKLKESPPSGPQKKVSSSKTILFLSSSPDNLETLRFGEEINAIKDKHKIKRQEEFFSIADKQAVVAANLPEILQEYQPFILHISLHSSREKGLLFQDEHQKKHPVTGTTLANILRRLKERTQHSIHCVLINACQSNTHAEALKEVVDYAIGMEDDIPDEASLAFTEGFYSVIFEGMSVPYAFDEGIGQIELMRIPKIREDAKFNHELPQLFHH